MNKKILSVVLILCVMLAVMPMTAYAANIALCRKCGQIQTVRVTYQYANDKLPEPLLHARCVIIHGITGSHTCGAERRLAQAEGHARIAADLPNRLGTTGALGRRTAMKRPTPESVSVTPAIRKPRIATAARRPAPPRLSARSAAANTARWRHTASLPKKQRRSI